MEIKDMTPKELVEGINREFEQMKSYLNTAVEAEVKKFGAPLGDTKAAIDKFNLRLDALEVQLKRPGRSTEQGDESEQERAYKAAFNRYARKGEKHLSEMEIKSLATDSDPDGGYLLPRNVRAGIIEKLVQFSPIRSLAAVETIGIGDALEVPKEGSTNFGSGWTSERATRSETTSGTFALDKIPTFEQYAKPLATQKSLDDLSFSIESWISRKVQQRFAVLEGTAFVSGDGVTQPEGLLTNADIAEVVSQDANLLTPEGLMALFYALPDAYASNGSWVMKRTTIQAIRSFKNGIGEFVWQPGLAVGQPPTIEGRPYVEAIDMPTVAAGNYPILFGDFRMGYTIVDRQDMRVLRDPFSSKPYVEFYTTRRVGGQVVLAEAIVKQKVSA